MHKCKDLTVTGDSYNSKEIRKSADIFIVVFVVEHKIQMRHPLDKKVNQDLFTKTRHKTNVQTFLYKKKRTPEKPPNKVDNS